MSQDNAASFGTSRRTFMAASGAAVFASSIKMSRAGAQVGMPFQRKSLLDPQIGPVLDSYRKAITAMLQLPPTNPLNWYRIAFIHELDCPHQNWWFLPWHRGFIGWFEQICRTLSGDPTFALPYWDWTATPQLPSPFGDDSVLNPGNSAFIASLQDFQNAFNGPVNTLYQNFTPPQLAQIQLRNPPIGDAPTFLNQISGDFFPIEQARQSDFGGTFPGEVSLDRIHGALAPTAFADFGSKPAPSHNAMVGEGLLETHPHDNVHGAVGGFMSAFMSPVDPIFYMHHSNIDRLWDVWTRKQQKIGQPTLPEGAALASWKQEPFLFYVDAQGNSVPKNTAGDYASMDVFNYNYQPGMGEDILQNPSPPTRGLHPAIAIALTRNVLDFQEATIGSAMLPADSFRLAGIKGGRELVARITLELPPNHRGVRFHVLVNPPVGLKSVSFSDPSFAGTITPFGGHGGGAHMGSPSSFDVSLNGAIRKLRAAKLWEPGKPIRVQVVPDTKGVTATPFSVPLKSITIITV
jgi:tyrosinase